jgi:drug/metabolite transporter (DMT)-like permease
MQEEARLRTGPSRLAARLLIVLTALLWSTGGMFAKAPVFDEWREAGVLGPALAFWRAAFAGLLLLPAVKRPRFRMGLVPMVVCFATMNVTYLSAMSLTTAANAIWLQCTAPLWILVVGALFLREPASRGDVIPLVFGMAGIGVILAFEMTSDLGNPAGIALGLASGVTYGSVVLFLRRLRGENEAFLVALNLLSTATLVFPYVIYRGLWPTGWQWLVLAAFGLLQMGLPYVLFARALRTIPGTEASLIALAEPLLLPLVTWLAWGEVPAWWTVAGGMLILIGLAIRYTRPQRPTPN